MVRFGLEIVPYHPVQTCVEIARKAEEIGIDQVWVCEHFHNRHAYSVLTAISLQTARVRLGPGITNPYLTHPVLTATAIATLNEVSKGRALLGISAGDPIFLTTAGIQQRKPVTAVKEAIQIIRGMLRGETVNFQGEIFNCHGVRLRFKVQGGIPIYVGGRRPRMLRMASEFADGVLLNAGHPDDVRDCIRYLGNSTIEKAAYVPLSLEEDVQLAKRLVKGVISFMVSSYPPDSLIQHGIDPQKVKEIRAYLLAGRLNEARSLVDDKMVDIFAICDLKSLEMRVSELEKIGIDRVIIGSPISRNPVQALDRIKCVMSYEVS